MSCLECRDLDEQFDPAIARRELSRYRKRGAEPATRLLIRAIEDSKIAAGATLLDVGGGVGAIQHELLDRGFSSALQVDASSAYLKASADEADRVGHTARAAFRHANFREIASELPEFDVVTLDRVVCCDPDYATMLDGAASRARRLVALTYPRDHWPVRLVVAAANALRRLTGRSFRAYVHKPAEMAAVLEGNGLKRRWNGGTIVWAAEVFER